MHVTLQRDLTDLSNSVEISSLTVQFGSHTALMDINLTIKSGEFISVIGPNGGGKSTLVRLILGLIQPNIGTIYDFGSKPSDLPSDAFGYVPQIKTADRSFPALPIELVASGLSATWPRKVKGELKEKALDALKTVGAEHLADRPLSRLSGGELQRIYLARSIVRNPKILILDEPATGFDSTAEMDLNKTIENIHKVSDTTIIMVTHDWESAFHHSDRVAVLNKNLICCDTPDSAFSEDALRVAFGHIGHTHEMLFGAKHHH